MSGPQVKPRDRSHGLAKLGVSEGDVQLATKLLEESFRLRSKALSLLGTTEEEIETELEKNLGSLGTAGRRRSNANLPIVANGRRKRGSILFTKLKGKGQSNRRHTLAVTKRRKSSISKHSSSPSSSLRRRSSDSEISIRSSSRRVTMA